MQIKIRSSFSPTEMAKLKNLKCLVLVSLYWNGHSHVLLGGEFGICTKDFKLCSDLVI